jgi:hypothetical protein
VRLDASVYLLNEGGKAITAIPLHLVGTDGTSTADILLPFRETIFGERFRLGMRTAAGGLNGASSTVAGTGFDLRTGGGMGRLQLVSPNAVSLGAGLVALGALRRARSAPRARP